MRASQLARMVFDNRDDEMQLDVCFGQIGSGFEEASGLGEIAGDHATPLAAISTDLLHQPRAPGERKSDQIETARGEAEDEVGMVLKILADAGRIEDDFDAGLAQMRRRTNARQHQDLRRLQRAGAEDDFTAGAQLADSVILLVFDADGAAALEQNFSHARAAFDPQIIAPPDMGLKIGARRAPALAIFLSQLIDAEAFLILAVEIVAQGHLRLARGLDENAVIGVIGARARHIERPVRPVETVVKILVAFRLPEIGQHLRIGPAASALLGPMIVIAGGSARIDHGVDGRRTAERLAARLIAAPAVEARLRRRFERPVIEGGRHHQGAREGRVHDP